MRTCCARWKSSCGRTGMTCSWTTITSQASRGPQPSRSRYAHADAVIAIVSPKSLQSEMLEFEIETAHDQQTRTGKPIFLPVTHRAAE